MRRPWVMVWSLAAAQVISWGTLFYAFALMVNPMRESLGWSPALLNGALSLGLLCMGAASIPVGAWIDRHGGRGVMAAGSLAGALALAGWAWVSAPWALYLVWALMGISMAGTLYEPAFAVVTAALGREAPRGIITLTLVGGFASTVCLPATQYLISAFGWRHALWALAAANLAICLPLHLLCVPPGAAGRARAPRPAGALYRALLRRRTFWGLALWFTTYNAIGSALVFQLIPLMREWRLGTAAILFCMMLIGPLQVAGRLVWMIFSARLDVPRMGGVALVSFTAALLGLLLLPHRLAWLGAATGLYGLGNGVMTVVRGTAVPELIGPEDYGAINGALAFPMMIARAFAPVAAAAVWLRGGDPAWMLGALLGCALLGGLGFALAVTGRAVQAPRGPAPGRPGAGRPLRG
jgi:MFS family permease